MKPDESSKKALSLAELRENKWSSFTRLFNKAT